MCESFLSLAFLTEFGKDPNATTLFFLALCFAQNPIKWATCRMTKLVNKTVFFKVVDFGWKSWFCVFALIKYRWITWAADNFLSSRGKKKRLFYTSMDHECSSYRWGEGGSKNDIFQSVLSSKNLIKNLKIRLQSELMKHQECLLFHFR